MMSDWWGERVRDITQGQQVQYLMQGINTEIKFSSEC